MINNKYKYILASASPRRYEILKRIIDDFEVITSDVDEVYTSKEPGDIVMELATLKGKAVAAHASASSLVISADTIVFAGGKILGKPRNRAEVLEMLDLLKGKAHQVYTGVCVIAKENGEEKVDTFYEATDVYVDNLSDSECAAYADTDEPYDKAGGYAIQGLFAPYITGFKGDYYNVVGFPLNRFYRLCKEKGYLL